MLWLTVGLTIDGTLLNVAILLCLLENECNSRKKIRKEETISITWDVPWVFCVSLDAFPTNLGVLLTFCS